MWWVFKSTAAETCVGPYGLLNDLAIPTWFSFRRKGGEIPDCGGYSWPQDKTVFHGGLLHGPTPGLWTEKYFVEASPNGTYSVLVHGSTVLFCAVFPGKVLVRGLQLASGHGSTSWRPTPRAYSRLLDFLGASAMGQQPASGQDSTTSHSTVSTVKLAWENVHAPLPS